jgi:hypothetical protein
MSQSLPTSYVGFSALHEPSLGRRCQLTLPDTVLLRQVSFVHVLQPFLPRCRPRGSLLARRFRRRPQRLPLQRPDGVCVGIAKWIGSAPRQNNVVRKKESHSTLERLRQRCHQVASSAGSPTLPVALVVRSDGSRAYPSGAQLVAIANGLETGSARHVCLIQFRNELSDGVRCVFEFQASAVEASKVRLGARGHPGSCVCYVC